MSAAWSAYEPCWRPASNTREWPRNMGSRTPGISLGPIAGISGCGHGIDLQVFPRARKRLLLVRSERLPPAPDDKAAVLTELLPAVPRVLRRLGHGPAQLVEGRIGRIV